MTDSHKVVPGSIEERIKREVYTFPWQCDDYWRQVGLPHMLDHSQGTIAVGVWLLGKRKHTRLGLELLISIHRIMCAEKCAQSG